MPEKLSQNGDIPVAVRRAAMRMKRVEEHRVAVTGRLLTELERWAGAATQLKVAEVLQMSQGNLSDVLAGRRALGPEALRRLWSRL